MTAPPDAARPRVLVNFASSVDGKINPAPGLRHGKFMMSPQREDFRRMVSLRAQADAVLIGASNLRADNPDLAIPADEQAARRARGAPEPARIVVTTAGHGLSPDMRMFDPARGGPSVVVHTALMPRETRARLSPVAELVELAPDRVDTADLLAWLARRGVRTLLCEGGGALCAELFAARAVDALYLTLVPRILGGARAPTLAGGPGFPPDQIPAPRLASLERVGDELYLRYEFSWD
ncbi:MAG TPA: dihydrofolate reductase family protein [Polyangia bacterium]|nr:dihydrofolate reductase family protein [Polyangia bacterium]